MERSKPYEEKNKLFLVISYLTLRKAIGILGISFPVILVTGSLIIGGYDEIQSSISSYYHTNMRDVFVGILCGIALFLFSYRGYNLIDNIAGDLGCLFALGVAFFPAAPDYSLLNDNALIGELHLVSAALFFIVLIYFSLFLFTKSVEGRTLSKQKKYRNRVYRICGFTMFGCILLIALYLLLLENCYPDLKNYDPVFWLESIAIFAFGISWLTKGQIILKDINE